MRFVLIAPVEHSPIWLKRLSELATKKSSVNSPGDTFTGFSPVASDFFQRQHFDAFRDATGLPSIEAPVETSIDLPNTERVVCGNEGDTRTGLRTGNAVGNGHFASNLGKLAQEPRQGGQIGRVPQNGCCQWRSSFATCASTASRPRHHDRILKWSRRGVPQVRIRRSRPNRAPEPCCSRARRVRWPSDIASPASRRGAD